MVLSKYAAPARMTNLVNLIDCPRDGAAKFSKTPRVSHLGPLKSQARVCVPESMLPRGTVHCSKWLARDDTMGKERSSRFALAMSALRLIASQSATGATLRWGKINQNPPQQRDPTAYAISLAPCPAI